MATYAAYTPLGNQSSYIQLRNEVNRVSAMPVDTARSQSRSQSDTSTANEVVICCVFPLPSPEELTDDEDEYIYNPMEKAREIFWLMEDNGIVNTMDSGFPELKDREYVPAQTYNAVVRQKFLEICHLGGASPDLCSNELIVDSSFESSDGEEYFISFALPNNGKAVERLIAKFPYPMTYSKKAYEDCHDPNVHVLHNADQEEVLGQFMSGETDNSEHKEPLRNVDCIRLFNRHLARWMSLTEMINQKVMREYFYPEQKEEIENLKNNWGSLWRWWRCPPKKGMLNNVRDYYGEEIAFFYFMFAHVIRLLWPFGVLGLVLSLGDHHFEHGQFLPTNTTTTSLKRGTFAFYFIIGTGIFTARLQSLEQRAKQKWGMEMFTPMVTVRRSYNADISSKNKVFFKFLSLTVLVSYMTLIVAVNVCLQTTAGVIQYFVHEKASVVAITGAMLLMKCMWTPIARKLTNLENCRTEDQWGQSFAKKVAFVQIFNTVLPFLMAGFGAHWVDMKCDSENGWADNPRAPLLKVPLFRPMPARLEKDVIPWLKNSKGPQYCLSGCLPLDEDEGSEVMTACLATPLGEACTTTCTAKLFQLAVLYYLSYIAIDLGCVVLAWMNVVLRVKSTNLGKTRAVVSEDKRKALEHQSKLLDYTLGSLGGSVVEDYVEIGLLCAPVFCFAVVEPSIVALCTIVCLILYRTMAWRMTTIDRRPYPRSSMGMGVWLQVLVFVGYLSIACQVAIFIFELHPMRSLSPGLKILLFTLLEHVLIMFVYCIRPIFQERPKDVEEIEDMMLNLRRKPLVNKNQELLNCTYPTVTWNKVVDPRLLQLEVKDVKQTTMMSKIWRGVTDLGMAFDDDKDGSDDSDEESMLTSISRTLWCSGRDVSRDTTPRL